MPNREDVRRMLALHVGRTVKLHLADGEPFVTTLQSVDEDGFVHEMEERSSVGSFQAKFEDVVSVEPVVPAREP